MKQNVPYLKHIRDEINFLLKETQNLSYKKFISNELLKRASSRSIEIIGEATKNLSNDFKKKYNDIEWKDIAGMRDKIIHFYFGVKWDIVWSVIKHKIPELKTKIEAILNNLE